MEEDEKIIDAMGGTSAVAKLFEIKPSSVSEWRIKGIPKARRQTLKLMRPDLFVVKSAPAQKADVEIEQARPVQLAIL